MGSLAVGIVLGGVMTLFLIVIFTLILTFNGGRPR